MGWVLRLVEAETGGGARGVDVLEISRRGGLGDIGHLGLTLAKAKPLLARGQQVVAAAQAHDHAVLRPGCSSCSHTLKAGEHLRDAAAAKPSVAASAITVTVELDLHP